MVSDFLLPWSRLNLLSLPKGRQEDASRSRGAIRVRKRRGPLGRRGALGETQNESAPYHHCVIDVFPVWRRTKSRS